MRWSPTPPEPMGQWRDWFAWRPVLTEGGVKVWLEWIERQCIWRDVGAGDGFWEAHYRLPEDGRAALADEDRE